MNSLTAIVNLVVLCGSGQGAPTDSLLLSIGSPGRIKVDTGLYDTRTGKKASLAEVVESAKGIPYVLVGESHDNLEHHQFQAKVIQELARNGRNVMVGLEMFTRPVQSKLYQWTLGRQSEEEFIVQSDWKKQWGFDFALYRPIFEVARENQLRLVALNVPRDWVRAVGRGGASALTEEQRSQVPELYLSNPRHREVFNALMGGHAPTGGGADNIYAAQVLWDEGMADTATKFMNAALPNEKNCMVIVAGSGHVMYGEGIGFRIQRRTKTKVLNIVCIEADAPREVSRGLGDFVYVTKPVKR